jgi:hypothetical protein
MSHNHQGFMKEGQEMKVLKLHKAMYGLRVPKLGTQSLIQSFSTWVSESASQTCFVLLSQRERERERLIVEVYANNLIIMGESIMEVSQFKEEMKHIFNMSDLGTLSCYLGIEVRQDHRGIGLSQSTYATKLLERTGMGNCNPCALPMEARLKLSKESDAKPVDLTEYRSLNGNLRYLLHTRLEPELTLNMSHLNKFMDNPRQDHMAAIKHLFSYVASTVDSGLFYPRGHGGGFGFLGYSGSDMARDIEDNKSTSGMIFFLGDKPTTWSSEKQCVVALSSCEAEYIARTGAACQAIWLSRFLEEVAGIRIGAPWIKIKMDKSVSYSAQQEFSTP